jgi:hypothetical protein
LTGYAGGRLAPARFAAHGGHATGGKPAGPAVIDDSTPMPPHARFSWGKFWRIAAVGLSLWAGGMITLSAIDGPGGTLAQMGWFFTKAALLTFGGAYAVLPYVYQGAVDHYGWLTALQMIDGLALGETTPGPLIMVVAFVGFLGGWNSALFGPDALFAAGAVAAVAVTFFTFLPSFVFILLGAPFVETTRGNLGFTAPLTAITAAVRCHPQSRLFLRLPRSLAARPGWGLRVERCRTRPCGVHRPVAVQGRRDSRHSRVRRVGVRREPAAPMNPREEAAERFQSGRVPAGLPAELLYDRSTMHP